MSLLGPDGNPINAGAAVQMSERNAEQKALEQAEFKIFVAQWDTFCKAETADEAVDTIRGRELIKMGLKEEALRNLHAVAVEANKMVMEFPERDVFMLQVMEFSLAIMSGNPRVLNNPQFVATVCCTTANVINPMSPKEQTNE